MGYDVVRLTSSRRALRQAISAAGQVREYIAALPYHGIPILDPRLQWLDRHAIFLIGKKAGTQTRLVPRGDVRVFVFPPLLVNGIQRRLCTTWKMANTSCTVDTRLLHNALCLHAFFTTTSTTTQT